MSQRVITSRSPRSPNLPPNVSHWHQSPFSNIRVAIVGGRVTFRSFASTQIGSVLLAGHASAVPVMPYANPWWR